MVTPVCLLHITFAALFLTALLSFVRTFMQTAGAASGFSRRLRRLAEWTVPAVLRGRQRRTGGTG